VRRGARPAAIAASAQTSTATGSISDRRRPRSRR
jgi:hypothetical protein